MLVTDHKQARKLIAEGMDHTASYEAATSDHNTWHCSLTLDPREGQLSDETWRAIANDFMREMGFTGREDGVPDARWAAVHHGLNEGGGDHIHIAMGVVRPDGSLADRYLDYLRAQSACNRLEHEYGLQVLASREEGGAERATKPGERARAERLGTPRPIGKRCNGGCASWRSRLEAKSSGSRRSRRQASSSSSPSSVWAAWMGSPATAWSCRRDATGRASSRSRSPTAVCGCRGI